MLLEGGKSVETIAIEPDISAQSLKQCKKKLSALPATCLGQCSPSQFKQRPTSLF